MSSARNSGSVHAFLSTHTPSSFWMFSAWVFSIMWNPPSTTQMINMCEDGCDQLFRHFLFCCFPQIHALQTLSSRRSCLTFRKVTRLSSDRPTCKASAFSDLLERDSCVYVWSTVNAQWEQNQAKARMSIVTCNRRYSKPCSWDWHRAICSRRFG